MTSQPTQFCLDRYLVLVLGVSAWAHYHSTQFEMNDDPGMPTGVIDGDSSDERIEIR